MQEEHGPKKKDELIPKSIRLPANVKMFLDEISGDFEVAEWLRELITHNVESLPEYREFLERRAG